MKTIFQLLLFGALLTLANLALAQDSSLTKIDILSEIERITQNTNWLNESEAKKASDRLQQLSEMLENAPDENSDDTENQSDDETDSTNIDIPFIDIDKIINSMQLATGAEGNDEIKAQTRDMVENIFSTSINEGEYADLDMAKPVRDAIIAEYKEEEKEYKHPGSFNETGILVIDFSDPNTMTLIPRLSEYSGVKTLIITGGKYNAAPYNLNTIFNNARAMKLEKLLIINFKNHLKELPKLTLNVSNLKYLALFNNKLSSINSEIIKITTLEELYVDVNPIKSIPAEISALKQLKKFGIAQTQLDSTEIGKLEKTLPNCKILSQ